MGLFYYCMPFVLSSYVVEWNILYFNSVYWVRVDESRVLLIYPARVCLANIVGRKGSVGGRDEKVRKLMYLPSKSFHCRKICHIQDLSPSIPFPFPFGIEMKKCHTSISLPFIFIYFLPSKHSIERNSFNLIEYNLNDLIEIIICWIYRGMVWAMQFNCEAIYYWSDPIEIIVFEYMLEYVIYFDLRD